LLEQINNLDGAGLPRIGFIIILNTFLEMALIEHALVPHRDGHHHPQLTVPRRVLSNLVRLTRNRVCIPATTALAEYSSTLPFPDIVQDAVAKLSSRRDDFVIPTIVDLHGSKATTRTMSSSRHSPLMTGFPIWHDSPSAT
jgi:hypothetical protein